VIAQLAGGDCDIGAQNADFSGSLPLLREFEREGLVQIIEVAGTVFEHLDFNIEPAEEYGGAAATLRDNRGAC
jgi:peptide/nickel transport system substrate-binding protein